MPSSEQQQNKDQNGNFSVESEEERINRNMAKFLSMEKQQQQLVLCLRQQQMPKSLLQMGALRKTTVACNFFYTLCLDFVVFLKKDVLNIADGHESYLDHVEDMIEQDLRPIRPQPNSPESMQIYAEHRLVIWNFF